MKSMQKAVFVTRRLPQRIREHNLTLISAGVAFYAFLAFVPTLIAVVSVYGLVAEPSDVARQVNSFASALPDEVEDFITFQLRSIVESSRTGVSVTLAVSLVIALWSASGGMAALITGLHVAQEREQPRSFVTKRGKALLLTIAAVVLLAVVVFLVAVLPGLVDDLGTGGKTALAIVRWPVLALVMLVGIGALYRLSVRDARRGRFAFFTPGVVVATLGWIVVSAGFAFYTANFAALQRHLRVAGHDRRAPAVAVPQRPGDPRRRRGRLRHSVRSHGKLTGAAAPLAVNPTRQVTRVTATGRRGVWVPRGGSSRPRGLGPRPSQRCRGR